MARHLSAGDTGERATTPRAGLADPHGISGDFSMVVGRLGLGLVVSISDLEKMSSLQYGTRGRLDWLACTV